MAMAATQARQDVRHEPTLADLLQSLWRVKLWIGGGIVAGVIGAVLFMAVAVPQYRVSMMVAPADGAGRTDIKALLPDNPSFALQYLVNTMGSQDTTDFARFENTLRGPLVADAIADDPDMMAGVEKARHFKFQGVPDIDDAASLSAWLERNVRIAPVGMSVMRKITMDHPDPQWAMRALNILRDRDDSIIRNDARERASRRAAYLHGALAKTNNPDHRRALTALLMEQEHVQMILAIDEPFAAMVAEPASVSARPVWPRKSLVFPCFLMAGAVLGYLAALAAGRVPRV